MVWAGQSYNYQFIKNSKKNTNIVECRVLQYYCLILNVEEHSVTKSCIFWCNFRHTSLLYNKFLCRLYTFVTWSQVSVYLPMVHSHLHHEFSSCLNFFCHTRKTPDADRQNLFWSLEAEHCLNIPLNIIHIPEIMYTGVNQRTGTGLKPGLSEHNLSNEVRMLYF